MEVRFSLIQIALCTHHTDKSQQACNGVNGSLTTLSPRVQGTRATSGRIRLVVLPLHQPLTASRPLPATTLISTTTLTISLGRSCFKRSRPDKRSLNDIRYSECDENGFEGCLQNFSPGFTNYTDVNPDDSEPIEFKQRAKTLRRRELVRRQLQRRNFFDTLGKLIGGAFKKLGGAITGNKKLSKEGDANIKSGLSDIKVRMDKTLRAAFTDCSRLRSPPRSNSTSL